MVHVTGLVAATKSQPVKTYSLEWTAGHITVPTSKSVLKLCKYFRLKPIRKSKNSGIHSDGKLFSYN